MSFTRTRTLVSLGAVALAAVVAAALAGSAGSATSGAPLTAHLLRAGELRGFVPDGVPEVVREPLVWAEQTAAGRSVDETAALRRLGFVAAASVHLRSSGRDDRDALSYAVEFRTAQGAHAYLVRTTARLSRAAKGERVALLCAIQPVGALRLDVSSPGSVGHNLLFQRGRVVHLVGVGHAPDAVEPPSALDLAAAASALVRRSAFGARDEQRASDARGLSRQAPRAPGFSPPWGSVARPARFPAHSQEAPRWLPAPSRTLRRCSSCAMRGASSPAGAGGRS